MTIYTCPDCDGDLIDEGLGLYCPACEHTVSFPKAITDGDLDD